MTRLKRKPYSRKSRKKRSELVISGTAIQDIRERPAICQPMNYAAIALACEDSIAAVLEFAAWIYKAKQLREVSEWLPGRLH